MGGNVLAFKGCQHFSSCRDLLCVHTLDFFSYSYVQ